MQNEKITQEKSLQNICITDCKGSCCDPWWGIIFYTIELDESKANDFNKELEETIQQRVYRIQDQYKTKDNLQRPLFKDPEKYNVSVDNIKRTSKSVLQINLRAMFAFRCLFLDQNKICSIHPTILKTDIRPSLCAELGIPGIKPDQKGYCRIIDATKKSSGESKTIHSAVEFERNVSQKHYEEGVFNIHQAAESVIQQIKVFSPFGSTIKKLGRNDHCYCGSGQKYKKCHGRQLVL